MRLRITALILTTLGGVVLAQDASREAVDSAALEVLTSALAALVTHTRDDALERGVVGIPVTIREAFEEFIPSDVLGSTYWRIDDDIGIVGRGLFQAGAVRAVTFDNVIIFSNADEAANAKLWAHELYHVMQYRQWGIEGFADRYIADRRAIEHDAREFRWSWMKATGRVPSTGSEATALQVP